MSRKKAQTWETEQAPFPSRLSEIMRERQVSQGKLATALGVQRQTVSLYKTGQSSPNAGVIRKIAEYFKVSSDWLLGLTDIKSPETRVQAICEYTGLSDHAVKGLHTRRTDPSYSQVLEALITHPEMLQTLHTYLTMNIDSIKMIAEDEQGAHFTGEYLKFFGLMDSEKGKGIPVRGEVLKKAISEQVMQDLERLKTEMGGGNP